MNFEANLNHFQFKIRKVFVWRVCINFNKYVCISQWVFFGTGAKVIFYMQSEGYRYYNETLNEIMILIYGIS